MARRQRRARMNFSGLWLARSREGKCDLLGHTFSEEDLEAGLLCLEALWTKF